MLSALDLESVIAAQRVLAASISKRLEQATPAERAEMDIRAWAGAGDVHAKCSRAPESARSTGAMPFLVGVAVGSLL